MSEKPKRLRIHRRVRPIRLAFLVRPNDRDALMRVFEINTCLWGGRFNPIVPVFRRTPAWWVDKPPTPPTASEIVGGYLAAFEPDFIVAMEPSLVQAAGAPKSRVLPPDDVLNAARDEHVGYGVSACDVYQGLYEREFRFVHRHPRKVGFAAQDEERFAAFAGAAFGRFPSDDTLQYFLRHYRNVFDAAPFRIVAADLRDVLGAKVATPLRVGASGLEVQRSGWRHDPVLFLIDATSTRDLIDYWNLRALGWRVLPIPIQWRDDLLSVCNTIIRQQYVPLRWQPQYRHHTEILASRSLTWDDARSFIKKLDLPGNDAVGPRHYPRIWDEWARDKDGAVPCTLDGGNLEDECGIADGRISFQSLSPSFATSFGPPNLPMWANVVHLRDYSAGSEVATILPPGIPDVDRLLDTMRFERDSTRVTSEGIVALCDFGDRTIFWSVLDGVGVLQGWFKSRGLDAELSGAGRICMQMIRQLGGPWGAHLVANPHVLHLLDEMAHGMVESLDDSTPAEGPKPKARGRTASWSQWWGLLRKIHHDDRRAERDFGRLTKHGVLQVGLKLDCPHCAQTNWYSLKQVAENLRCDRCLQPFQFPAARPPTQAWAYRTQGPFSIENYAHGAYAVAIALRFFLQLLQIEATWAPSLKLKNEQGDEFEIDFAMWCQARHRVGFEPTFVIGECKSFKEQFEPRDLRRARELAKLFPGALLVFATLREELEPAEKRRIAGLARTGRRRTQADKWRNPVLVLTAHEVMGRWGPPHCWQDAGGAMAEFATRYGLRNDLIQLCDATQQLHLGMESDAASQSRYFARLEQRWRRTRAGRPQAAGGAARGETASANDPAEVNLNARPPG
jgi:hypothetical protein